MGILVSCALGLEPLLTEELENLCDGIDIQPTRAGVRMQAGLREAYRVVLWSRVASRVLMPVFECNATVGELYQCCLEQDWSAFVHPGARLAIDFSGTNKHIRHTRFGALKIKDALADWHRARNLAPPLLTRNEPEIRFSARIRKGRVSIALDFSGQAMHRRGYRERQGHAPLRETLAAALLYRAGWPEIAAQGGVLLDPMCGSGTLVIEGAMMAANAAPGLRRAGWGFSAWPGHDPSLWQSLLAEADLAFREGRRSMAARLFGSDVNTFMVTMARDNASRAAVQDLVSFSTADATTMEPPVDVGTPAVERLLITNPPHGERLGDEAEVAVLHERLGENFLAHFQGWKAVILAASADYGMRLGLHSYKQYRVHNGARACLLLLFDIDAGNRLARTQIAEPSPGAQMVANRIRKNVARLNAWLSRDSIEAFRAYDADIPEYSAAVDLYQTDAGKFLVVQEYAAPASIEVSLARHRLNELITGAGLALGVPGDRVHLKARERRKHPVHTARNGAATEQCTVTEGRAVIEVNLQTHLDTGLFLDHRPIRREIFHSAAGKSFLNLFSYTSVATVQAALGGARRSLSVDMSNTYLQWSERNFRRNRLNLDRHRLLRADCLQFLREQSLTPDEKFDMIFLDPPSFSNSKRMDRVLDVQRDHVTLIRQAMRLLEEAGLLIFSTNLRTFRLDTDALDTFNLTEYTEQSLDPDFRRNRRIHHCWKITAGSAET